VADKAKSSELCLKVPNHNGMVEGTGSELMQSGLEGQRCDGVFVASKRPFQGGIGAS
jgi:hypothetical protein